MKNTIIEPPKEYTKKDRFGPLEREAHAKNLRFLCAVVPNNQGGFLFFDEKGYQKSGERREGEPEPTVEAKLTEFDRQQWKLEVRSQHLNAIIAERKIIDHFRKQGHSQPIQEAIAAMDPILTEKPEDYGDQAMKLASDLREEAELNRVKAARDYRFNTQLEQTKTIAESVAREVSETVLTGFEQTMGTMLDKFQQALDKLSPDRKKGK